MQIIKPSASYLDPTKMTPYEFIERIGRTCYKSEDSITKESSIDFVKRMAASKHYAMLEHSNVIFNLSKRAFNGLNKAIEQNLKFGDGNMNTDAAIKNSSCFQMIASSDITDDTAIVSASFRTWLEVLAKLYDGGFPVVFAIAARLHQAFPEIFELNGDIDGLSNDVNILTVDKLNNELKELVKLKKAYLHCDSTEILRTHMKHTIKFVCDRGVSHEFVRHRMASFAQESTRYCNYSKAKFGNEITVIEPCFWSNDHDSVKYRTWLNSCENAETAYFDLLAEGATPQEARSVLPNSLKTEIFITASEKEWQHIVNLRQIGVTGAPHPQMQEVMDLAAPILAKYSEGRIVTGPAKTITYTTDTKKASKTNSSVLFVKKLTDTAQIPTRASLGAAGFDLYADSVENEMATYTDKDGNTVVVAAGGSNTKIHTGIAIAIPAGYVGLIFARSGLACKQGLRPANCVGVIDEDYRGELIVQLYNDPDFTKLYEAIKNEYGNSIDMDKLKKYIEDVYLEKNAVAEQVSEFKLHDRVAQIVFVKYEDFIINVVTELDETVRGTGGFGSTGQH